MVIVPFLVQLYLVNVGEALRLGLEYIRTAVETRQRSDLPIGCTLPLPEASLQRLTSDIKVIIHTEEHFLCCPVRNDIFEVKTVLNSLHKVNILLPLSLVSQDPHLLWSLLIIPNDVNIVIHVTIRFSISFQVIVEHFSASSSYVGRC